MNIVKIGHIKPKHFRKLTTDTKPYFEYWFENGNLLMTNDFDNSAYLYWDTKKQEWLPSTLKVLPKEVIYVPVYSFTSRLSNYCVSQVVVPELGVNKWFYQANTDDYPDEELAHCKECFTDYKFTNYKWYPSYIDDILFEAYRSYGRG